MKVLVLMGLLVAVLGGCGGGDGDTGSSNIYDTDTGSDDDDTASSVADGAGDGGSANAVVDPTPPGRATASIDGLDLSFELPGPSDCSITDEAITFAYMIGDNEITLGAGANRVDDGWMGSIRLNVANPDGEAGPVAYYPAPGENGVLDGSLFAVDGASMSYEGPMLKQPANDGSNPPPVEVGTGTVSATCG